MKYYNFMDRTFYCIIQRQKLPLLGQEFFIASCVWKLAAVMRTFFTTIVAQLFKGQ